MLAIILLALLASINTSEILLATEKPFTKETVEDIKKLVEKSGNTFKLLEKYKTKQELMDSIKDANAIIVRSDKITKEIMDSSNNLKVIARAGAGFDNIDLGYASKKGIVVMNTPGQNANAVAELVFGLLVYAKRNFYDGSSGTELKGKKLGLLAFGNVGRNVARIAKGFGMEIYSYDAFVPKEVLEKEGIRAVDKQEDLFTDCDIVSLHIPATKETINSINYDLCSKMKKNAILINTSRKEVINEKELIKLMEERKDIKYITDLKPDNHEEFLNKFKGRYFATPKKMGAQTQEANINAGKAAANQIIDFFKTGKTKFQVNK
jgi:D-3-phosphoglycerate dehydrogenase